MHQQPATGDCDHCGLSLGTWPYTREIDGVDHKYCCYGCFIGWEIARGGSEESAATGLLVRLGIGAFLSMNIMLFSLAIYSQGPDGFDPAIQTLFHYVLFAFSIPVVLVLGGPYILEAISDISRRRLGASSLIAIGTVAAFVYSSSATIFGGERVYFDTVTMVLCLFTLGRYLEANGRVRAMRNLAPMLSPATELVSVINGGKETERNLCDIEAGDLVRFQPGSRILVDGEIVEGACFADESWLTGEGVPVEKQPGSHTFAGTINLDGTIIVLAEQDGMDTRWVRICRRLHQSLSQPTRLQNITDRVAMWFVPFVLSVSIGTVWYWSSLVPVDVALMYGLSVLVVACPCALGLAAPLATALSLENLGASGVLVRSGDVLFDLAKLSHLAMDKTGTLTVGKTRVVDVVTSRTDDYRVIAKAAALESGSSHPLARGIVSFARKSGIAPSSATEVRVIAGRGVTGNFSGEQVSVGTRQMFSDMQWQFPDVLETESHYPGHEKLTRVYVGWEGIVYGAIILDDEVHDATPAAVHAIQSMGVETSIISGDSELVVSNIAKQTNITKWSAGLSPDEKAVEVSCLKRSNAKVAMVGDGINDGLALFQADIGIAVGNSIDLAREAADVVLPDSGVMKLPEVISQAIFTRKTIKTNLVWAISYNLLAIGLAAMGQLRPEFAAALMAGSSLLVIANSVRLQNRKFPGNESVKVNPGIWKGEYTPVPKNPEKLSLSNS